MPKSKIYSPNQKVKTKNLLTALTFGILLVGSVVAYLLLSQTQDIRQQASTGVGPGYTITPPPAGMGPYPYTCAARCTSGKPSLLPNETCLVEDASGLFDNCMQCSTSGYDPKAKGYVSYLAKVSRNSCVSPTAIVACKAVNCVGTISSAGGVRDLKRGEVCLVQTGNTKTCMVCGLGSMSVSQDPNACSVGPGAPTPKPESK